ncbi:MAG: preprotein translocase subunit SecG, partial [Cyclobacteriaceae bacterium]
MSTTKILTIVFAITSIVLAYFLFDSINSSIVESRRVEKMERAIINKLKMVREAQLAYKAVNGTYTSD